ncbi:hypothetical protein D3C83_221360 [compost metagenome]
MGSSLAASRKISGHSRARRSAPAMPKTSPSSSEFEASRLAPWMPVAAASPKASRPGRLVTPSGLATTPPMK